MTIQRGLKAVGTFSCQSAVYGVALFTKDTSGRLLIVQAAEWLERFPVLQRMIKENLAVRTPRRAATIIE
jgi:hypothetical protein